MGTYTAEHYRATTQCVADAIQGDGTNETQVIECLRRGQNTDAICAELARECEGSTDWLGSACSDQEYREYWGTTADGGEWKVRVVAPVEPECTICPHCDGTGCATCGGSGEVAADADGAGLRPAVDSREPAEDFCDYDDPRA